MSKVLIVDDADPSISFSGDWQPLGTVSSTTYEYNGTVSVGWANGQSLSYTFDGTDIAVYGSVDMPATKGLPGVEFKIDSLPPEKFSDIHPITSNTFNATGFTTHQALYRSPHLLAGTHTINISITDITSGGPYFWLDFLIITTDQESVAGHVIVDDRDPAIQYHEGWKLSGNPAEYLQTIHWPNNTDSYATMEFNGTDIYVYGTTDVGLTGGRCKIGFELDGVTGPEYEVPNPDPRSISHNLFFSKTGLAPSNHSLKILTLNDHVWTLDYIVYTTSNSSAAGTSDHEGINTGGDSSSGTATEIGGAAGANPGGVRGGGGKSKTGAIAGSLVGLGAVILLLVIFLLRKRRRNQLSVDSPPQIPSGAGMMATAHGTVITSYETRSQSQSQSQPQLRWSPIPPLKNSTNILGAAVLGRNSRNVTPSAVASTTIGDRASHLEEISGTSSQRPHPPLPAIVVRTEVDSGQRFRRGDVNEVSSNAKTAPPVYTED